MKLLLTAIFLLAFTFCSGQKVRGKKISYDLTIPSRPAVIAIKSGDINRSTYFADVGKITYTNLKPGYYSIQVEMPGRDTLVKGPLQLQKGQQLVLNILSVGSCIYDRPAAYVPVCPHNHTDSILPIAYGLIAERVDRSGKGKIYPGGCIITGCDPQYYCSIHKQKF